MLNKKRARLRRASRTRFLISKRNVHRLTVHRTNLHIYAQLFSTCGERVLASASTSESEVRKELVERVGKGGNVVAAEIIGRRIANRARAIGIESVAFDRSGFRYHGRVKALAEAARESGLRF